MTWLEFMERLKWTPDISGCVEMGWIARYRKRNDPSGYFEARIPAGTPYQTVVDICTKAINEA